MKILKSFLTVLLLIVIIWFLGSIWVQRPGKHVQSTYFGSGDRKAVFIYDPDPFISLDQKIANAYSKALHSKGWSATIFSVNEAMNKNFDSLDLMILCANSYNLAPDRILMAFLKKQNLVRYNISAVTVGVFNFKKSQSLFEAELLKEGVNLIDSKSYWFINSNSTNNKLNDEELAFKHGLELAEKLK